MDARTIFHRHAANTAAIAGLSYFFLELEDSIVALYGPWYEVTISNLSNLVLEVRPNGRSDSDSAIRILPKTEISQLLAFSTLEIGNLDTASSVAIGDIQVDIMGVL